MAKSTEYPDVYLSRNTASVRTERGRFSFLWSGGRHVNVAMHVDDRKLPLNLLMSFDDMKLLADTITTFVAEKEQMQKQEAQQ